VIKPESQKSYAAVVGIQKCTGLSHLKKTLKKVLKKGGEGVMLRKAGSVYETCRSDTLLKVKYFHDEEAKVLGSEKGKGRCWNMMGKINCVLPNGINFKIGTGFTDKDRKNPPPKGSIVTFKYQELSHKGVPRFPVFMHRRPELTWDDVLENAKTKIPFSQHKKRTPDLEKKHSILFSTVPSRDQLTGVKIVTNDDEDSDADVKDDKGDKTKDNNTSTKDPVAKPAKNKKGNGKKIDGKWHVNMVLFVIVTILNI